MNDQERWLPVVGYEGYYEVSDQGRVRSVDRVLLRSDGRSVRVAGRMREIQLHPHGYLKVSLSKGGKTRLVSVHRMVLEAFGGPPPEPGLFALHDNGIKLDVRPDNLYWGTHSDNMLDLYRRHGGVHAMSRVEACPRGHLLQDPNLFESDKKYRRRGCKSCQCAHRIRDGLTWDEFLVKADRKYRSLTGLEPNLSAPGRSPKVAI